MDETLSYIQLVYKVLNSWYVKLAEITPSLIVGILVFVFFLTFSKYLSKVSVDIFHRVFPNSRQESVTTLIGVFRFLIMIMGTFISLEIMGFSGFFIKFLGSLGVAGVIAGVALKDLVSSIFSGMLIGIDKAFKVGDYVTIGGNSGNVLEIGLLTTKIITDDGRKVYIPNQVIFNQPFFNVTASPQRRIILDFEIPADEDIYKAKESAFEVIKKLDNVDRLDTADVVFTSLKQGAFTLQVKFWIKIGSNITTAKSQALMEIKKQFDIDGIHLVTPTSISIANPGS
ncbi:mechanosensitive ion channel family protein [Chryseobacterium sp. T1]